MDFDQIKQIFIDNNLLISMKSNNYILKCPYCGDHPSLQKIGHLYVSNKKETPVFHCFLCDETGHINKLIKDITGNAKIANTVAKINFGASKSYSGSSDNSIKKIKINSTDTGAFSNKISYLQHRTNNKIDVTKISNVVLDFNEFFKSNYLTNIVEGDNRVLADWEMDILQENCIGFLSRNHSYLYCRNSDLNSKYIFRKIPLQSNSTGLLDYWSIDNGGQSNTIVLAEGIFDILREYSIRSLPIDHDDVRCFAAGNSFSYSSLLQSVCYNINEYRADVIILSDNDKHQNWYRKFLKENKHLINNCKIYYNTIGDDFGDYRNKIKVTRLV